MPRKPLIALICSLIILLLAAALPATVLADDEDKSAAQQTARNQERVTKVFKIEHGSVDEIAEILVMFGGVPRANKELGVIAWQGPAKTLAAVEAAVESLDVPPQVMKNVELTMYILAAEPGEGAAVNDQVPEVLNSVTTQIRKLFDFQSIRLLESSILRTRDGQSGQIEGGLSLNRSVPQALLEEGTLATVLANSQGSYQFKFRDLEVVSDEAGNTVRVNRLALMIILPATYINNDGEEQRTMKKTQLVTDIDVREGQKVVVGKTSIEGARDTMFLVLTAEILD